MRRMIDWWNQLVNTCLFLGILHSYKWFYRHHISRSMSLSLLQQRGGGGEINGRKAPASQSAVRQLPRRRAHCIQWIIQPCIRGVCTSPCASLWARASAHKCIRALAVLVLHGSAAWKWKWKWKCAIGSMDLSLFSVLFCSFRLPLPSSVPLSFVTLRVPQIH